MTNISHSIESTPNAAQMSVTKNQAERFIREYCMPQKNTKLSLTSFLQQHMMSTADSSVLSGQYIKALVAKNPKLRAKLDAFLQSQAHTGNGPDELAPIGGPIHPYRLRCSKVMETYKRMQGAMPLEQLQEEFEVFNQMQVDRIEAVIGCL
jgi:hypothetical protein